MMVAGIILIAVLAVALAYGKGREHERKHLLSTRDYYAGLKFASPPLSRNGPAPDNVPLPSPIPPRPMRRFVAREEDVAGAVNSRFLIAGTVAMACAVVLFTAGYRAGHECAFSQAEDALLVRDREEFLPLPSPTPEETPEPLAPVDLPTPTPARFTL